MTRFRGAVRAYLDDALVFAGLSALAVGLGLFHPGLGLAVFGAGLILAVRLGS